MRYQIARTVVCTADTAATLVFCFSCMSSNRTSLLYVFQIVCCNCLQTLMTDTLGTFFPFHIVDPLAV